MLPALGLFVFGFIRLGARESTLVAGVIAVVVTLASYLLFHWLLVVPWPDALIGDWWPELRAIRALRLF